MVEGQIRDIFILECQIGCLNLKFQKIRMNICYI
jgi:hypothetical protein